MITLFCVVLFSGKCFAFDDGDFQYWNTEVVFWKISDNWKLLLEEEFRFGGDAKDFYYQHSDLGFIYSGFAQWLDLGANYRHIYEKNKGKWFIEDQPHL